MTSRQLRDAGVAEGTQVVLVKGGDPTLVRDLVAELIDVLAGDDDKSFCVEDVDSADLLTEGGQLDLGRVIDASHTPPFLTARRVVVARGLGFLTKKDDVESLLGYLADPSPTTSLVLVWDKPTDSRLGSRKTGPPPKAMLTAASAVGAVLDADPGTKRADVDAWLQGQLADAGLKMDAATRSRLLDWIGEARDRVPGLITTLAGIHGVGASIGAADLEPHIDGEEGGVPPWDLTDAIDAGDVGRAVDVLHRMLRGGDRHPLALMAILNGHVIRMLALDGAEVTGKDDAARVAGCSPFQAGKALAQGRRLGHDRIVELVELLATADVDLRGGAALHSEAEQSGIVTMEVLVARMASRSAATGGRRPATGRAQASGKTRTGPVGRARR
jgi:DNA polymerase III subunit delta